MGISAIAATGDKVSINTLSENPVVELEVTGIIKTGYALIDEGWGFVSLETAEIFNNRNEQLNLRYGIKLDNRYGDKAVMAKISQLLGPGYTVKSWREFNSKFFRALFTEKFLMTLIIGLIFIIVSFGIFYSLRRTVHEKIEEIALLKALGTSSAAIKQIFVTEGFLIGVIGALAGTVLGLLVGYNVNEIFRFIEWIANQHILPLLEELIRPFAGRIQFAPVSIFAGLATAR